MTAFQYCDGFCRISRFNRATGIHVSAPILNPTPPHPIPLGCPRTPALTASVSGIDLAQANYLTCGNMHVSMSHVLPCMQGREGDTDVKNRLLDPVGESEGGLTWEISIKSLKSQTKTCCLRILNWTDTSGLPISVPDCLEIQEAGTDLWARGAQNITFITTRGRQLSRKSRPYPGTRPDRSGQDAISKRNFLSAGEAIPPEPFAGVSL